MEACEELLVEPAPGVLFITFEGDGRLIFDDAADRGWSATTHRIFLVDGNKSQELFSGLLPATIEAFDGAIGTAPSGPDPGSVAGERRRAFQSRFFDKFEREVAGEAEDQYDAVYLAAAAIELAGTVEDHDAIRVAMARTHTGAAVDAGDWGAVRAAAAAGNEVDFQGASGDVNLDPATGELLPPYYISLWSIADGQIEDGEVEVIDSLE
jgi:ABC-type branched-subunit amino acid transport system substrate-binding protein